MTVTSGKRNAAAMGLSLARDLVNRPAADKPPAAIADIAAGLHRDVSVTVYDERHIEEMGFGGLVAVNRGSDRPADGRDGIPAGGSFEDRGVRRQGDCVDFGGLSIKSAANMETMKILTWQVLPQ